MSGFRVRAARPRAGDCRTWADRPPVPESGRTCCSRGDRAGSAEPRADCPSLSLLRVASTCEPSTRQPVAGSRPAPYHRTAHLSRRLIGTFRSSADCLSTRAGAGKTTPEDVYGHPVHGRQARVMSRAHGTPHAPSPPGSTPTQARASAAGSSARRDGVDRNIYYQIARLQPGHDLGAEAGGVATSARQRGLWP